MTALAVRPVDAETQETLHAVAGVSSPLGTLHAADFRLACEDAASVHPDGLIHPSAVSALLHDRFGEIDPRWLSSMWGAGCSRSGFMDKTDVRAPIDPTHSRGNGGKDVRLRRLRGDS